MANQRLSTDKRALILAVLIEGTPINAVCRMFSVGKNSVLRVIAETGEALANYMDKEFRDLHCQRLAIDEQWQYVGKHGCRMDKKEEGRGDFWLWAAIDSDTKLVVSHKIGTRGMATGGAFVIDLAKRVTGPVQITSDAHPIYENAIIECFDTPEHKGMTYAIDKKVFVEKEFNPALFPKKRVRGVDKIVRSEREPSIGSPDLSRCTTSHVERFFLTMRQELKRFQRLGLGYSKDLEMHKLATAMHIGIYNLCRKHKGINGQTPAQAAGIAAGRWTLECVVEMTDAYWKAKEEAAFTAAFEVAGM